MYVFIYLYIDLHVCYATNYDETFMHSFPVFLGVRMFFFVHFGHTPFFLHPGSLPWVV